MHYDLDAPKMVRMELPVDTLDEAKAMAEKHMAQYVKRGYAIEWVDYPRGNVSTLVVKDTKGRRTVQANVWEYLAINRASPAYRGPALESTS